MESSYSSSVGIAQTTNNILAFPPKLDFKILVKTEFL